MSSVIHAYVCNCTGCQNGTTKRETRPAGGMSGNLRRRLNDVGKAVFVTVIVMLLLFGWAKQAGAQDIWLHEAAEFNALFAEDSTLDYKEYTEDGGFTIKDIYGNTWKGCRVGTECAVPEIADDSEMVPPLSNLYLPYAANRPSMLDDGGVCSGEFCTPQ